MKRPGPLLSAAWPFVAVFAAVTLLDVLLQRGARTQLEACFANPFIDVAHVVGEMLKWGALLASPAFLLGRAARFVYVPLWVWLVAVETVECIARIRYGMSLDGDWLMIVLTSSALEMREFFGQFGWRFALVSAGASSAALLFGVFFFLRIRYPRRSGLSALFALMFVTPFLLQNLVFSNPLACANSVMFAYVPVDTLHNFIMFRDVVRTANSPRLPPADARAAERAEKTLGVFVIGESASRNHWHLYGYGRPTTPIMDACRDELVVFRDVRSCFHTTGKSLRMLLTEATRESPSETRSTFPQQCAAAGYRCSLLSAHSRWGRWDGVETLLFSGCERKCYLSELPEYTPDFHDDRLLPLFDDAVVKGTGQVLFLHLTGSHAPPVFRYPRRRAIYPRYEGDVAPGVEKAGSMTAVMCDMYDNSIAFTDVVLGEMLDRLRSLRQPSFLVYVSDHGETPRSGFWRDGSSADLSEVPFVIWFSPEYRARFPETVSAVERMADVSIGMDGLLPIFRSLVHVEEMR